MDEEDFRRLLFEKYGEVTRARGFFLYTKSGKRLLDLWRGTKCVIGYTADKLKSALKRECDRGIVSDYVCASHYKMLKSLETLFASPVSTEVFHSEAEAFSESGGKKFIPFKSTAESFGEGEKFFFAPPLAFNVYFVITRKAKGEKSCLKGKIENVLASSAAKSVYSLLKVLKTAGEKDFFRYDVFLKPYFTRRGFYLFPKGNEEEYEDVVKFFLEKKIVINPIFQGTSMVPLGVDRGCFRGLLEKNVKIF